MRIRAQARSADTTTQSHRPVSGATCSRRRLGLRSIADPYANSLGVTRCGRAPPSTIWRSQFLLHSQPESHACQQSPVPTPCSRKPVFRRRRHPGLRSPRRPVGRHQMQRRRRWTSRDRSRSERRSPSEITVIRTRLVSGSPSYFLAAFSRLSAFVPASRAWAGGPVARPSDLPARGPASRRMRRHQKPFSFAVTAIPTGDLVRESWRYPRNAYCSRAPIALGGAHLRW